MPIAVYSSGVPTKKLKTGDAIEHRPDHQAKPRRRQSAGEEYADNQTHRALDDVRSKFGR